MVNEHYICVSVISKSWCSQHFCTSLTTSPTPYAAWRPYHCSLAKSDNLRISVCGSIWTVTRRINYFNSNEFHTVKYLHSSKHFIWLRSQRCCSVWTSLRLKFTQVCKRRYASGSNKVYLVCFTLLTVGPLQKRNLPNVTFLLTLARNNTSSTHCLWPPHGCTPESRSPLPSPLTLPIAWVASMTRRELSWQAAHITPILSPHPLEVIIFGLLISTA